MKYKLLFFIIFIFITTSTFANENKDTVIQKSEKKDKLEEITEWEKRNWDRESNEIIRIISARRATKKEQNKYLEGLT